PSRTVALLLPPDLLLELPAGQAPGRVQPQVLALCVGNPCDLPDLGPGDFARVEGGLDQRKLLQAPGEEDELVRPLALGLGKMIPRPLCSILVGLVHLPLVHVVEVEPDRAVGDFSLALVIVKPFDEFPFRQTWNQFELVLHGFPPLLRVETARGPLSAADSTIGLSALRKRAETARGGARRSGLARVTTDRKRKLLGGRGKPSTGLPAGDGQKKAEIHEKAVKNNSVDFQDFP